MVSVMTIPILKSATLMVETAVELVSIPSTVLNVSALGKTWVLGIHFWTMASVRMN